MMTDRDLFDAITNAAIAGCDCDTNARRETIWNACVSMLASERATNLPVSGY